MFAALMLDFYGTVVHEDDAVTASVCERVAATAPVHVPTTEVAKRWSQAFARQCRASFGDSFKRQRVIGRGSLVEVLAALASPEDPDQLLVGQFRHWREPPLFEDTRPFLASIEVPVCIVSNIDRSDLEAALDHHGLDFDHVVTSEDVESYKPRPEIFLRALQLLGVDHDAVLHVGDSLSSDVVGANGVGIPVAWVNRSARRPSRRASFWAEVTNLNELADLLRRG